MAPNQVLHRTQWYFCAAIWVCYISIVFTLALAGQGCARDKTETGSFEPENHGEPATTQMSVSLQVGDLLFQDLHCGPPCDAIKAVTDGVDGANFAHVAMVTRVDSEGTVWVIEAVSDGVVENTLADLLARSRDEAGRPPVLVGRLAPSHQHLIPEAIVHAQGFLGLPYDPIYEMDNTAFYCSELIYEAFRMANDGEALFSLEPMTFARPDSNEAFPAWEDHYEALGVAIPEGEPGLNPAGMSRAPFLDIVFAYGRPDGYTGPLGTGQTD